jgi:hypothetical protein
MPRLLLGLIPMLDDFHKIDCLVRRLSTIAKLCLPSLSRSFLQMFYPASNTIVSQSQLKISQVCRSVDEVASSTRLAFASTDRMTTPTRNWTIHAPDNRTSCSIISSENASTTQKLSSTKGLLRSSTRNDNSSTINTLRNLIESFEEVGQGYCLDSHNNKYSSTSLRLSNASDNDCLEWCSKSPYSNLIAGVSIKQLLLSNKRCYCHFKSGTHTHANLSLYASEHNPPSDQIKWDVGLDTIKSSNGANNTVCYKSV